MISKEKIIKGLKCCANGCLGDYCPYFKVGNCGQLLTKEALELLKEQDTYENCAIAIEDRQPVVRCKDCKYWRQLYGYRSSTGCCDCDDMWRSLDGETTEVSNIITDSDFYCGYAERR